MKKELLNEKLLEEKVNEMNKEQENGEYEEEDNGLFFPDFRSFLR